VQASGAFSTEGMQLVMLVFVLIQGDVVTRGIASGDDIRWHGDAPALGLKAGEPVLATAVALFRDGDAVQTVTWTEVETVTSLI
jgi:hypothetical protein